MLAVPAHHEAATLAVIFQATFDTININNKELKMNIRKADEQKDYDKAWDIFTNVISTGDTYVFDPKTPKLT